MIKIGMETDKIGDVGNMISSVEVSLKTNSHINDLINSANAIVNGAFIVHMSQTSVSNPKLYKHMYEWGQVGDPNSRLWKHVLRGAGANRMASFDFKASKKAVPISPAKQAVGVKSNHIFVWKAPVLELGLPVKISPKIAKVLVLDPKGVDHLIFTDRTINIPHQGDPDAWNAFTQEYMRWYISGIPETLINSTLGPRTRSGVRNAFRSALAKLRPTKTNVKTMKITPTGIDKNFVQTINRSLHTEYIAAAANRRVENDE